MEELPVVLTVGLGNSLPENLIKNILVDDPFDATNESRPTKYSWQISNKYYSAQVLFRVCSYPDLFALTSRCPIEAVIICLDCITDTFLVDLHEVENNLRNLKAAIQILVCNDEVPEDMKNSVQDWCVKNNYELIELKPKNNSEISEDDIEECFGIYRVREVLHAHQWPNLITKGGCREPQNSKSTEIKVERADGSSNYLDNKFDLDSSDDMEQLSTLFKDLQFMKKDMSSLSGEERLKQAERVVKTFWKAMQGDSDEFSQS